jgi:hypothetical protein
MAMTRPAEPRPRPGRLAALLACAALVAVAGGVGCNARRSAGGGSTSAKAEQARRQAEAAAVGGAKAAAEFAARNNTDGPIVAVSVQGPPTNPRPPAPPPPSGPSMTTRPTPAPPRPVEEPVIRERVSSELPHPTAAEAEKDALEQAQRRIEEKLAELDPPVRHRPTVAEVKARYLRKDSLQPRPLSAEQKEEYARARLRTDLVFVDCEVTVSAEQVRELRAQDRVLLGLKVIGGVAAAALAGFLFLRLDEWTKGYLTSWLAVAAFALAGGVAATLALV